jgi:hypothetical protein
MLSSHLRLPLLSRLFRSGFPTNILYASPPPFVLRPLPISFAMLGGYLVITAWRGGDGLQIAANVLNKQSRTTDKGRFSSFGVGRGANNFSS